MTSLCFGMYANMKEENRCLSSFLPILSVHVKYISITIYIDIYGWGAYWPFLLLFWQGLYDMAQPCGVIHFFLFEFYCFDYLHSNFSKYWFLFKAVLLLFFFFLRNEEKLESTRANWYLYLSFWQLIVVAGLCHYWWQSKREKKKN